MPRGGKRVNSGRKKGSDGAKTKERRALVEKYGDPLEVILAGMKRHLKARRYEKAEALARDAAPYCTPRLASMQVKAEIESEATQVVEFIVTSREQADQAIADLAAASGVPRQ